MVLCMKEQKALRLSHHTLSILLINTSRDIRRNQIFLCNFRKYEQSRATCYDELGHEDHADGAIMVPGNAKVVL